MFVQTVSQFTSRAFGVIRLDRSAILEIDQAREARNQAVAIVILAGMANGIPNALMDTGFGGLLAALIGNIAAWLIFAGLAYVIGVGMLPAEATEAEATRSGVYQTVGFAQAPNLLAIAGIIGILGQIIALVGLLWMVVCSVVSVSVSLRVGTGRALIIAAIAGIITLIAISLLGRVLGWIFGIPIN